MPTRPPTNSSSRRLHSVPTVERGGHMRRRERGSTRQNRPWVRGVDFRRESAKRPYRSRRNRLRVPLPTPTVHRVLAPLADRSPRSIRSRRRCSAASDRYRRSGPDPGLELHRYACNPLFSVGTADEPPPRRPSEHRPTRLTDPRGDRGRIGSGVGPCVDTPRRSNRPVPARAMSIPTRSAVGLGVSASVRPSRPARSSSGSAVDRQCKISTNVQSVVRCVMEAVNSRRGAANPLTDGGSIGTVEPFARS